jgi:anaerobic ribonucleoside-triphosphate reductase activating protein
VGRYTWGEFLNVAAVCGETRALGPGVRAVVWVQGCPFRCHGCVAPEWIPDRPARLVRPAELVDELLASPAVTGLTFSGGEPMRQAEALAELARRARGVRELSLICFTGYRLEELRGARSLPGVAALLAEVDVLIDGRYVAAANDGRGLRGSTNQRVHHLTGRLRSSGYDFEHRARTAEVRVTGQDLLIVGVPPRSLVSAVDKVLPGRR